MQASGETSEAPQVAEHLATFDDLFNVFSNQRWGELDRSHSDDIIVHWPDGHTTRGIEQHIKDLDTMFVFAPDTRISEQPISDVSRRNVALQINPGLASPR
ncbi:MAG: polyketide cyclase [Deltaproteobacteria bacterium]|nr:polyketide cyclase [Deltaproteobacteria bacterium]